MTSLRYEITIANPNALYNLYAKIQERIQDPQAAKHRILKQGYSLDLVGPSQRFIDVVDHVLEEEHSDWRTHSAHVLIPTKEVKIILRQRSLVDLVQETKNIQDYELRIIPLLRIYAKQYGEPYLRDSSHIQIFRLASGNLYCVLTRIFDQWEYNEDHPLDGWKPLDP